MHTFLIVFVDSDSLVYVLATLFILIEVLAMWGEPRQHSIYDLRASVSATVHLRGEDGG